MRSPWVQRAQHQTYAGRAWRATSAAASAAFAAARVLGLWPGAGPQRARRRPRGGGPAQAIEIDRFPRARRSACCGRPSRPCPTLNRTNVRRERDGYERNRTDDHVSHGPPAAPGDSGPPAHTPAPRLHPGHTPRSCAQPAGTTHYASPAPAAGPPHTAKRAPDRRDTPPAPREHHRRASRQTTQRISQATVDDVVLRHQPSNGGSHTRLFRDLRMRPHKARIRRMSCILNATVQPDGRTADHARKPRPPQARTLTTMACRHEPGAGAGTGTHRSPHGRDLSDDEGGTASARDTA
jgi:hypothetical protein